MAKKPREESAESASDRGRRSREAKVQLERARDVKALRASIAAAQATERAKTQAAIDRAREERLAKFRDDQRKRDR